MVAGRLLAVVVLCGYADGCSDATPGPFEFFVHANDYTGADETFEIRVDGTPLPRDGNQTVPLADLQFPDYATGLNEGLVVIETRMGDAVLDRCEIRPGACGSECTPDAESASVCIFMDGKIGLNTYDCPCSSSIADFFCHGDCASTGPDVRP